MKDKILKKYYYLGPGKRVACHIMVFAYSTEGAREIINHWLDKREFTVKNRSLDKDGLTEVSNGLVIDRPVMIYMNDGED